ncbi:hypothetical protein JCM6292_2627 [Bacteroides pyogenes JCM 6292]|uniref:Uncharacterized protein n=2 Tax=Bacteroides pyogenes TaxID=310300 RepID=W4PJ03_9BACE|nr:hypothetical protein JCM6292_2627 [Bacteroides pyogenes JCM 6292]GAE19665.1 hypothetical protein JCM6294_2746 [Bacteroides pyogenes DSM 20611 = JCM 6294]
MSKCDYFFEQVRLLFQVSAIIISGKPGNLFRQRRKNDNYSLFRTSYPACADIGLFRKNSPNGIARRRKQTGGKKPSQTRDYEKGNSCRTG